MMVKAKKKVRCCMVIAVAGFNFDAMNQSRNIRKMVSSNISNAS